MLTKFDAIFMLLMISYEIGLFTGIYIFYKLQELKS